MGVVFLLLLCFFFLLVFYCLLFVLFCFLKLRWLRITGLFNGCLRNYNV